MAHLRNSTKLASVSCILEREALLGEPTSAPMRVSQGTQCLPLSHLALCSPKAQGWSGLPPAPCALVLCSWWPELETNSKRVLLWGV